jgi:hypothetical protein
MRIQEALYYGGYTPMAAFGQDDPALGPDVPQAPPVLPTEFDQEQLAAVVAKMRLGGLIGAAVGIGIIVMAERG